MPFPAVIQLSDIAAGDGSLGFVVRGEQANAASGLAVASAGDVNGDGYADFLIGAPFSTVNGEPAAGATYLIYGNAAGYGQGLSLANLDGSNGTSWVGFYPFANSGYSVDCAGDINGDGFDDVVIGAYQTDGFGEAYLVFGHADGIDFPVDLQTFGGGGEGFRLHGLDAGDEAGFTVSRLGDINADGLDDFIIGAPGGDPSGISGAGESYIVFGATGLFAADYLDLSALDGTNGFLVAGGQEASNAGRWVAEAGDFNGDGIADFLVSASATDIDGSIDVGRIYVVFGSADPFQRTLELSALDENTGFIVNGVAATDYAGRFAVGIGDLNGDGFDDIAISSPTADPNGLDQAGETYVIFGSSLGAAGFDLTSLDGSNGFVVRGLAERGGMTLAAAGDVNGDGFADLIIGVQGSDPDGNVEAGTSYVIFGTNAGFEASFDLATLDGTNGFAIIGVAAGDRSGGAVASAGDINGDGYDDLLIGAYQADPNGLTNAGETYIIYGHASGQTQGTSGDDVLTGARGEDTLNGYEGNDTLIGSGSADVMAGGAGDDFYESITVGDIVIELADEGTDTIRTRVEGFTLGDNVENLLLFGTAISGNGNELDNRIVGTSGANSLFGFDGNDVLEGLNGHDTLQGGAGDDYLNGGSGDDSLAGSAGNDFYDAATFADTIVELADEGNDTVRTRADSYILGDNVENLILSGNVAETGSGNALANQLTGANRANILFGLDGDDLLQGLRGADTLDGGAGIDTLEGGLGNDTLAGGGDNDLLIGGAGRDALTGGAGADTFALFDGDFAAGLTASADHIADFSRTDGDRIDLSGLDAIIGTPEGDSFAFVGTAAFSGTAGELRYIQRDGFVIVQGDTDGDGLADFGIRVDNLTDLTVADFVL